jgi:phosphoribosyl 1,2-cyclic phosphodiesterase
MEIFVLGSSSSGNSAVIRHGSTVLLLDAGLSARKIMTRLTTVGIRPDEITAVLLTHEHGDHTNGLPVLLRYLQCDILATRLTQEEVVGSDFRSAAAGWKIFSSGSIFKVGCMEVTPFSVPHDAVDPVGFRIYSGEFSLGIATDLGHSNHSVRHHLSGVNALFVEANHDESLLQADTKRPFSIKQRIMSPHGHLSNRAAGELAKDIWSPCLRHVVLGHLSRDCNTAELATETVRQHLPAEAGVGVFCATQDEILHVVL